MTTTENTPTTKNQDVKRTRYIIGRTYNKHGVSDYYMGKDEKDGQFMFSSKVNAKRFTNQNEAYGMTIRLKRLLPSIMGGSPATYTVIEVVREV